MKVPFMLVTLVNTKWDSNTIKDGVNQFDIQQ